jgi:hypothetical protein
MRIFRRINAVPAIRPAPMAHTQSPFGDVVALIKVAAELKRALTQEASVEEFGFVSHGRKAPVPGLILFGIY